MKIAIPNCFAYLNMERFLTEFVMKVNEHVEIIKSPPTTKEIIDLGVENSVDEICIPAKAMIGHIEYLMREKIDALLLPRITSISKRTYCCPKIIGIVDLVRSQYNKVELISPELNLRNGEDRWEIFLFELGRYFTDDKRLLKKIIKNYAPFELFDHPKPQIKQNKNILLLGHSYVILDNYLNCGVFEIIKNSGYDMVYPTYRSLSCENDVFYLSKPFFWDTAQNIYNFFGYAIKNINIDGIIYFMSFGCGIDSILEDLIKRRSKILGLPYLCITLDEHSANLGINTRIEAFIDMIEWRSTQENENHISTYGKSLYDSQTTI